MLNYKLLTLLSASETLNYTETAKILNLTQPAVTQHIKALEKEYQIKLFTYSHKKLNLTPKGKAFVEKIKLLNALSIQIGEQFNQDYPNNQTYHFGATKSIGEFLMPNILTTLLDTQKDMHFSMVVENTSVLLKKLKDGTLDFVLIEGYFDKNGLEYHLIKEASFIVTLPYNHPLANKKIHLEDLIDERLIVREIGSGSRDVLSSFLDNYNFKISDFSSILEIGNIGVTKNLVQREKGISFMYEIACQKELDEMKIATASFELSPFRRPFHFIFLKDSPFKTEYMKFYDFIVKQLQ